MINLFDELFSPSEQYKPSPWEVAREWAFVSVIVASLLVVAALASIGGMVVVEAVCRLYGK